MRSIRLLMVAVLVVFLALSSMEIVSAQQISLSPTCGPPGTVVIVTGSGFTRQASSFCEIRSNPPSLVGPTRGTDFDCNINAQGEVTGPDGPAFFIVASGASGPYSVTVWYAPSGEESAPVGFTAGACGPPPEPYELCLIELGVEEADGSVSWLPGYAIVDVPMSQCQDKTEYYTDVLGRTIVIHQFNQTRISYGTPTVAPIILIL